MVVVVVVVESCHQASKFFIQYLLFCLYFFVIDYFFIYKRPERRCFFCRGAARCVWVIMPKRPLPFFSVFECLYPWVFVFCCPTLANTEELDQGKGVGGLPE